LHKKIPTYGQEGEGGGGVPSPPSRPDRGPYPPTIFFLSGDHPPPLCPDRVGGNPPHDSITNTRCFAWSHRRTVHLCCGQMGEGGGGVPSPPSRPDRGPYPPPIFFSGRDHPPPPCPGRLGGTPLIDHAVTGRIGSLVFRPGNSDNGG